jgi:hypothetical protein
VTVADLGKRLDARIGDGFCWVSQAPISLYEELSDGEAQVTCAFSPDAVCLVFKLDRVAFPFLRPQRSVDWLLLLCHPDGLIEAHLVECKRKIDSKSWRDIKEQMSSSIIRALTLGGALGVEVARFFCYTAFRNDRISSRSSPDPVFAKIPIGPAEVAAAEPAASREARAGGFDWRGATIRIGTIDADVPHEKVQLDVATGVGRIDLATASSRSRF